MQLSREAARLLLLSQQGMLEPPRRVAKRADVMAAIRRMHLLQIDTITVIARSPYLVLYSRIGSYDPRWLEEAHAAGKLFEYWSHAMCWLPAEDWPLLRSVMLAGMQNKSGSWPRVLAWLKQNRSAVEHAHSRIRAEGPLKSADFAKAAGRGGPWWDWQVEKVALEYSFYNGELMIARRENFQRVYELRERLLPQWDDKAAPPINDVRREFVRRSALALGVATEPWLRDYYRMKQVSCRKAIGELLESGELLEATIEGVKGPAYLPAKLLPLARRALAGKLAATHCALLSPFDPLAWDRRRLSELFSFDYRIEIYTPQEQRRFGYFVLPILLGDRLVGRLCPKAHRKDGVFEIRELHLEAGVKLSEGEWLKLAACIADCAKWHNTPRVEVRGKDAAARSLKAALVAAPTPMYVRGE